MESIKQFYDDFVDCWLNNPRYSVRRSYLNVLGNVEGKRVLDIGCGCGFDIKELSSKGAYGTGIDFSEIAIRNSKEFVGDDSKWIFICDDFMSYRTNNKYDIVLFSMIVMHYHNLDAIFNTLSSFMKKGGLLLLVTNNPYLICKDYNLPYPEEDKCIPYKHHFFYNGETMTVPKYLHSFSDYINKAVIGGLSIVSLKEISIYSEETLFFNPVYHPSIPNFLSILYTKNS